MATFVYLFVLCTLSSLTGFLLHELLGIGSIGNADISPICQGNIQKLEGSGTIEEDTRGVLCESKLISSIWFKYKMLFFETDASKLMQEQNHSQHITSDRIHILL